MSYRPQFIIDEKQLTIYPSCREIERWLTFKERKLVADGRGGRNSVSQQTRMFWVLEERSHGNVIGTLQGLWSYLLRLCLKKGWTPDIHDRRVAFPAPKLDRIHGLRPPQDRLLRAGLSQGWSGIFDAPTRFGKCFGVDTPVMMFDGTVKRVQDIREGELVMGPDSQPRQVTGCVRGVGPLYQVTPVNGGMPWVCNEDHILHVERTGESGRGGAARKGRRENITVTEWLAGSKWFKHVRKLRRVAVDFPEAQLELDPYIYGCWLGDGHRIGAAFTNAEPEVWEAIDAWAANQGLLLSPCNPAAGKAETRFYVEQIGKNRGKRNANSWRSWFRARPKAAGIDERYLIASREQRLQLLAGLIDTAGEVNGGKNYGIVTKYPQLGLDIKRLCDSLGLPSSVKPTFKQAQTGPKRQYSRVLIRGEQMQIPVKVARKRVSRQDTVDTRRCGFEVAPAGVGEYFGFELLGPDRLFLLADCTVVHNTHLIARTIDVFPGLKTAVVIPGQDLGYQMRDDLVGLIARDISVLGFGSRKKYQGPDVTVCSIDSMDKLDPDTRLVLVDEVHTLVTGDLPWPSSIDAPELEKAAQEKDGRLLHFLKFDKARIYGFGATTAGRFDKRDRLIEGAIGPILASISYAEARDQGSVAPIVVFMCEVPYDTNNVDGRNRDRAYRSVLWESDYIGRLIQAMCRNVIPPDWQTLMFIQNESSAKFLADYLPEAPVAMAKLLKKNDREALMNRMARNELMRCFASNIYSQGVTFQDLRVVINLAGGGASTSAVQKPGRVAQVRPGKRCGVVIDFKFEGYGLGVNQSWAPHRESEARLKLYLDKGYEVVRVPWNLSQFPALFQERCL